MDFGKEEATKLFKELLSSEDARAAMSETVNKAFDDRIGRWGKKFGNELIEKVGDEVGGLLEERFESGGKPSGKGGDGGGTAGGESPESKRLAALEKELAQERESTAKARREKALLKALEGERVSGLPSYMLRGMLGDVEESDGEFFVGEKRLEEWAKDFARSDDGKRYIPAVGRGGTGAQPGAAAAGGGGSGDDMSLGEAIKASLAGQSI